MVCKWTVDKAKRNISKDFVEDFPCPNTFEEYSFELSTPCGPNWTAYRLPVQFLEGRKKPNWIGKEYLN